MSLPFEKKRSKLRKLPGVFRIAGQIVQFIWIVLQIEELSVSNFIGVVFNELPSLIAHHPLAIPIGAEEPIADAGLPAITGSRLLPSAMSGVSAPAKSQIVGSKS